MAADASILADPFFKDAYLLRDIVGNGYDVLGPFDIINDQTYIQIEMAKEFLKSEHKEAFDAYKALFVKFKELVNTRKKVIAADSHIAPAAPGASPAPAPAAPGAAPAAPAPAAPGAAPAPAAPGASPAPAINSHTKNELDKQYKKQLKELIMNRRHLHISIFFLVQTYLSIERDIRKLFSNCFIFRCSKKEMETIADELNNSEISQINSTMVKSGISIRFNPDGTLTTL